MDISNLLLNGSAHAIGAAIAARTLSSFEATRWYLQRIDQFNQGTNGVNAVRVVASSALAHAEQVDKEIAAGKVRGSLHGVPYLLKDNIFTHDGMPASAGALALADYVPPYEATLVTRLAQAGAILLGKTNLTEFADFVSDVMPSEFSGVGGVVRNPLGTRYDRGQGSSVGSAAAVAARFCAFAIGSETQNSIQTPAVYSSIVGFKPTVGRVSRHGVVPLVPSQDSPGPLTVDVRDAHLVFSALTGADPNDTVTLAFLDDPVAYDDAAALSGVRIGVPRRLQADAILNGDRGAAFERILQALSKSGAVIVDPCDLPAAETMHELRSSVFRTEFKAALNTLLATHRPCGIDSMEALIDWNARHPESIPYGQSLLEAANATSGLRAATYLADRRRDLAFSLHGGILGALAQGADVLLAPMSVAAKCTGKAGAPVVAIPAGRDLSGAPFGVTLYAEPGADWKLLRIAGAIEKVIGDRIEPRLVRGHG